MSQATLAPRSTSPPKPVDEPASSDDCRSMYIARIDELRRDLPVSESLSNDAGSPGLHFVGFFLVVFVFGQVMSQWALLSGHYGAWVAGLLFSLSGVAIALGSLLGGQRQVFHDLESTTKNTSGIRPHANYTADEAPRASA